MSRSFWVGFAQLPSVIHNNDDYDNGKAWGALKNKHFSFPQFRQLNIVFPMLTMNVIERARSSGRCPPSLLQGQPKEPGFEAAVGKVLDPNGTSDVRLRYVNSRIPWWLGTHSLETFSSWNFLLIQIEDLALSINAEYKYLALTIHAD